MKKLNIEDSKPNQTKKTNKAGWEEALLFVGARSCCFGGRRGRGLCGGEGRLTPTLSRAVGTGPGVQDPTPRGLLLTGAFLKTVIQSI